MSIAILQLKSEGQQVTIIEKLAKGKCQEQLFAKLVAEDGYKSCNTKIEAAKSCLNGYQSIFRHLESVPM